MNIACLFIKRKHMMDSPAELLCAWDEYSIEDNWEGWDADCTKALKMVGDDLGASRYINLKVSDNAIDDIFAEHKTIETTATLLPSPQTT